MSEYFRPYYEAVRTILDGTPVNELDDIRHQCNVAFVNATTKGASYRAKGYDPRLIIISFVADAENRILNGADPIEVYKDIKVLNPEEFRIRGRALTKFAIEDYFS